MSELLAKKEKNASTPLPSSTQQRQLQEGFHSKCYKSVWREKTELGFISQSQLLQFEF